MARRILDAARFVDYDLTAVRGLLRAVAVYREQIVQNFYDHGAARHRGRASEAGRSPSSSPPNSTIPTRPRSSKNFCYRGASKFIARWSHSAPMANRIRLAPTSSCWRSRFARTSRRCSNVRIIRRVPSAGAPERPYDVAGWTLPAQMGVDVRTIAARFETPSIRRLDAVSVSPGAVGGSPKADHYLIDARGNGGALVINRLLTAGIKPRWLSQEYRANGHEFAPGSVVVEGTKTARELAEGLAKSLGVHVEGVQGKLGPKVMRIGTARVALYKPWAENADEGWTRWLLERYEFQFTNISDADVRAGNLHRSVRRHHPADRSTGTVGVWKRSGRRAA